MLSPFQVPYPASMRVLPHPATHSCLTNLAFLYTGASSLHRTKNRSSINTQQVHPLIHMWLEPWVTPCVLFGW